MRTHLRLRLAMGNGNGDDLITAYNIIEAKSLLFLLFRMQIFLRACDLDLRVLKN